MEIDYYDKPYSKPFQYVNGIPIRVLTKRGKAVNIRFENTRQLGFIPSTYFDKQGKIASYGLDWWITRNKRKIELMYEEMSGGINEVK